MPGGFIVQRQKVGNQTEDNFVAGMAPNGAFNVPAGKLSISNIPIGSVAYGSLGTNSTDVAGQFWITDIFIPFNRIISTIGVLQGGTATTDNILVAIWDSRGALVGNSALAGSLLAGANTFKELALLASVQLFGPQQYYIGVQGNGATAGALRTIAASTFPDVVANSIAGTFGTVPASITPITTFTADKGPVVYVK
mgnify:CR=1 FL=1